MASIAPTQGFAAPSRRPASAPSRLWTLTEGRALLELGAFYLSRPLERTLPRGDGHTVLCLPGFLATNSSTVPMRGLLTRLGYDAHGWDWSRNVRVDNAMLESLEAQITRLHSDSGGKISLIGWSLGGVIARELAKLHPEKVRLVMSLGSPITNERAETGVTKLFEMLNGKEPEVQRGGRFLALDEAPPVPTTSVLTKTDGIVHWRGSVQCGDREDCENIVVHASHCGLGVNPSVMVALADRLAQDEGAWKRFNPPFKHRWMFPQLRFN